MLSFGLRINAIDADGEITDSFEVVVTDEPDSDSVDFRRASFTDDVVWSCNRGDFNALIDALHAERERTATDA